jgi:formylmethanofuran dehydrogenase subunit C
MSNFLANILQAAAKALGAVESIDAVAEQELAAVVSGFSVYETGSPVVLGAISVEGKSGKIVAIMDGGGASIVLGLTEAPKVA